MQSLKKRLNTEKWHYYPTQIEQEDYPFSYNENQKENTTMVENNTYNGYNGKVILLDNGHASTTPGKRSPMLEDGSQFFEY